MLTKTLFGSRYFFYTLLFSLSAIIFIFDTDHRETGWAHEWFVNVICSGQTAFLSRHIQTFAIMMVRETCSIASFGNTRTHTLSFLSCCSESRAQQLHRKFRAHYQTILFCFDKLLSYNLDNILHVLFARKWQMNTVQCSGFHWKETTFLTRLGFLFEIVFIIFGFAVIYTIIAMVSELTLILASLLRNRVTDNWLRGTI